jgi:hypothetical protein
VTDKKSYVTLKPGNTSTLPRSTSSDIVPGLLTVFQPLFRSTARNLGIGKITRHVSKVRGSKYFGRAVIAKLFADNLAPCFNYFFFISYNLGK